MCVCWGRDNIDKGEYDKILGRKECIVYEKQTRLIAAEQQVAQEQLNVRMREGNRYGQIARGLYQTREPLKLKGKSFIKHR